MKGQVASKMALKHRLTRLTQVAIDAYGTIGILTAVNWHVAITQYTLPQAKIGHKFNSFLLASSYFQLFRPVCIACSMGKHYKRQKPRWGLGMRLANPEIS